MNFSLRIFMLAATIFLASCSEPSNTDLAGEWTVNGDESHIAFVSIKSGTIVEAHSFQSIKGTVSPDGRAEIDIALDSVETLIDRRDERMREFLFETDTHPNSTITTQLDPTAFSTMGVGESITHPVLATLNLHGEEVEIETDLAITRVGADKMLVSTVTPIIIRADDFGLGTGLEKLRELANLPSITPEVPVTISIVFTR